MDIQWYPGHMTKAKRMMQENLHLVDALCEIIDARIPMSSRNPDLDELAQNKPRIIIMNRVDQADPQVTKLWREYFHAQGLGVLETDSKSGTGVQNFAAAVREALRDRLERLAEKGQSGKAVRVMVAGIPNVGKSTFINKVAKRKAAKASDKPGVTLGRQWVTIDRGLELLDTPGILWAKLDGENTGLNLAFTGAVRDEIMDLEGLACHLMNKLSADYPQLLCARYKLEMPEREEWLTDLEWGYMLLEQSAKRRGFLASRGEYDTERMAKVLLDEFRGGKLGRISLERPPVE